MPRLLTYLLLGVIAAGWQTPIPSPTEANRSVVPVETVSGERSETPKVEQTPVSTGNTVAEDYDYDTIADALEGFAIRLADLYDGRDETVLRSTFSVDGLASAIAFDWRLRGAVRGETAFRGEVSIRGFSTTKEEPGARPPLLAANIGLVAAPGAQLIDLKTGSVVQQWDERQDFAVHVVLELDSELRTWRATDIGPPFEFADNPPGDPGPTVRCPGLGPDRPNGADPVEGRTWCFGGTDGTLAYPSQVRLFANVPCGETRASVLTLGWPVGTEIDNSDAHQFVRDPDGGFDRRWALAMDYSGNASRPRHAYSTGLTDGEFEIWVSPASEGAAIWVRHGRRFERWPRVGEWGVIDCN